MKVCIAEKPSVARDIAAILGANSRKDGYIEGNGYQVTWVFGHLCTLKEPHEYNPAWKRWSLSDLPMIPQRFGIKLIENDGSEKQFHIIEKLISTADEVINCGDAGQEGELIQRWVMQKAQCKCPVKRLWISSLTEEAIKDGFANLRPQSDFDKLYEAGAMRAIGDWLLGMNATRLYTLRYGQNRQVLSIGRVQTPTLALIVKRHLEIVNFKPEQYWELKTVYRDTTFNATKGRFSSEEEGRKFLNEVIASDFEVTDISTKKGSESAPRLFDLTSLQVECNKKFGFSAEDTLRHIQSLYEKKVTTYPRVDTTYLSEDIYPKVPNILRGLRAYEPLTQSVLANKIPKSKKVFDNSKITDHHAIIPTGVNPVNLTADEQKVFDLVARRFIANFYPDCQTSTTTVMGQVEKIEFKATGKQILVPGWRVVFDKDKKDEDEKNDEEKTLPIFTKGERGPHKPDLSEKWTQPPKPYTEATLLRAMETAGKQMEDGELRDLLKENGIGRPSTRANIIETLYKRNYMRKEKKNIFPTQTGIDLIQTIQHEILKSAELTGQWEKRLRMIERNTYQSQTFMAELKTMVATLVNTVRNDYGKTITIEERKEEEPAKKEKKSASKTDKPKAEKRESKKTTKAQVETTSTDNTVKEATQTSAEAKEDNLCPICHTGVILKGKAAFGCSNWKNGCKLRIPFQFEGHTFTSEELTKLTKKETLQIGEKNVRLSEEGEFGII
ncbi:MAG: DNA topoisomerase 3 [Paludibacteraceae bacterium]|nr:DNA topoisomerase 3 [Paludibacteraceae bacterium]